MLASPHASSETLTPIRKSKRAQERFAIVVDEISRPIASLVDHVSRFYSATTSPPQPEHCIALQRAVASSRLPRSDLETSPRAASEIRAHSPPRHTLAVNTGTSDSPQSSDLLDKPTLRLNLAARTRAAQSAHVSARAHTEALSSSVQAVVHRYESPPSIEDARRAHKDISEILEPQRRNGKGHDHFEGDDTLRKRLTLVRLHLWLFSHPDPSEQLGWKAASRRACSDLERKNASAEQVCRWARRFLHDREDLPFNLYGGHNVSMLEHGDLAQAINHHLQTLGAYICAADIVNYLGDPEIRNEYGLEKNISLATAKRWLHSMNYRWKKTPSGSVVLSLPHPLLTTQHAGQYVDGHEREDVVQYRQQTFLPAMAELELNMRAWSDAMEELVDDRPRPRQRRTVVWYHDESTFYANDRRKIRWVHSGETPKPCPKGEGISLMVADFVSADYGWLRSPDGQESAQVLFRAGKNRDGYFGSNDIIAHAQLAMDILQRHYPEEEHVLIFDNATTHLKRADTALSARRMSKNPTQEGKPMFGVDVNVIGTNGKPECLPNGQHRKERVRMSDAQLPDGSPQSLYFPLGHPREGVFKGMSVILDERGSSNHRALRAECVGFKCATDNLKPRCCMRRLLWNQPDFVNIKSVLETECHARGFKVIFLPKFHCELSFLEMCWGFAKRLYREMPPSTLDADLERNVLESLAAVPLETMRR
jgi:hypothetical protein